MFYVLFLVCFQTCLLFSMEKNVTELTVDFVLGKHKIETPQLNPSAMISFFKSPALELFCINVKNDTENFINTLPNSTVLENAICKTQAVQYCCFVTMLYKNDLIISSLNKCLLPIPTKYTETEEDFKKFWYALWQLVFPQEKTLEDALQKIKNPYVLKNLLYTLMQNRECFINSFKSIDTPDYFYKKLVAMESCMTNDVEQDSSKRYFQYILPTFQETIKQFATIFDRIHALKNYDSLFQYRGPCQLTKTQEYPSFNKINTHWNNGWTSLDPQKKAEAFQQFCLELNAYIVFLDEHLKKAEEKK